MNPTVALLTARSLLGRRRALLLALLPVVLLTLAGGARWLGGIDQSTSIALLGGFTLGTMVPLLGVILGTGAIGPEIDDGSIVYLLSKPLSRISIVISKVAVAMAIMLVVGAVPTLLAGMILSGSADGVAVAYAVGAAIAGAAYCALFLLLAVLTRNAVVVGLLYAIVWESLIGSFVPGARTLSIQQWSLTVTERLLGARAEQLGVGSAVELWTGVPLVLAVVIGGTWYAGNRLRSLRLSGEA